MARIALDAPLSEALGSKSAFLGRLEKLGITTVRDLLWHFPVRYEDFSKIYKINDLEPGQEATICGVVDDINTKRAWRRGMAITEALITDDTGSIRAVWFNQPYIANAMGVGKTANLSGKISRSREGEPYFSNPAYEIAHDGAEPKHTARLVPVYPETKGLTSRGLRFIIQKIFEASPPLVEWIPKDILARERLPELSRAIRAIHFPDTIDRALAAKKRFAFEELFLLQLHNVNQKLKRAERTAPRVAADIEKIKAMLAALPFALTQSQKRSLWEIMQDMEKTRPMNRLLQGDVGSGKTVVAALAAVIAAENGIQTAFMAPTEILARQHFETMKKICATIAARTQPVIGLMTGSGAVIFYENDVEAKISKKDLGKKIADGGVAIVFGTHALIEKSVSFKKLGLAVVDEQHRFGVRQRAALQAASKTKNGIVPHLLSMSATPIPRTLMLTVFGDLDCSLITELPAGRHPIETKIVGLRERAGAYDFIRRQIKEGRQAFVICPRVEPTDAENAAAAASRRMRISVHSKTAGGFGMFEAADRRALQDVKSVKEEYEKLSKKIFPGLRVAFLHGRMKPKEKEAAMQNFKDGKTDILVATSVVEVGVDIPNASIMMIEGANRFGLAQLYQFRGRVGRGAHRSYCFLMADAGSAAAGARAKAIVSAKNGFELAEADLRLRGPGEFFGVAQSGFSDAAMEAVRNPLLVKQSREAAADILKKDPYLLRAPLLKEKFAAFEASIHWE